ncbi:MAG: serine hydrolase [Verrucomicrobiae bacterium]|nr:serine hydrolase [Verrucomicrobiae bacterium]
MRGGLPSALRSNNGVVAHPLAAALTPDGETVSFGSMRNWNFFYHRAKARFGWIGGVCWLITCHAPALFAAEVEGFSLASPESQGLSSEKLREMSEWVRSEDLDVRSLLVLRHGNLVLEWYAGDVSRDHNHNIYSITKSVVSLLAGLAIAEGKIDGIETTLGELFPDSKALTTDPTKRAITLEQLLTMRSGFPVARANKTEGPERELFDRINAAGDRTSLILEQLELATEPNGAFAYNNIDPQLVGSAIATATGEHLPEFAGKALFRPLGFENASWQFPDDTGQVPGGYGLRLRAIDLAKLGQLVLQSGKWNGKTIVDEAWIADATRDHTGAGYGYYWWLDEKKGVIGAKGVRGQRIEIVPALDLVFVVTAELPPARVAPVTKKLLEDFVLAAVSPQDSLPEDPEASRRLRDELETASQFRPKSRDGLPAFRLPQK